MDKKLIQEYKAKREQKGISIEEIAVLMGILKSDICQFELNKAGLHEFHENNYMHFIDHYEEFVNSDIDKTIIILKQQYKGKFLKLNSLSHKNKICKITLYNEKHFVVQYYDKHFNPTYTESFDYNEHRLRRIIIDVLDQEVSHKNKIQYNSKYLNIDFKKDVKKNKGNNLYIEQLKNIKQIKHMTKEINAEELYSLIEKFKLTSDEAEKNKILEDLLLGHINIAYKATLKAKFGEYYERNYIEVDDLFQIACLSILNSAEKIILTKEPELFKKFLRKRIWWDFKTHARNVAPMRITQRTLEHYVGIMKAISELTAELNRYPTIKEIAAKINKEIKHVTKYTGIYDPTVSMDCKINDDKDERNLHDIIEGYSYPLNPDKIINKIMLEEGFSDLSEKHKKVIYYKYVMNMENSEIAKQLNMNKLSIKKLVKSALESLKFHVNKRRSPYTDQEKEIFLDLAKRELLKNMFDDNDEIDKYIGLLDKGLGIIDERQRKYLINRYYKGKSKNKSMIDAGVTYQDSKYEFYALNKLKKCLIDLYKNEKQIIFKKS